MNTLNLIAAILVVAAAITVVWTLMRYRWRRRRAAVREPEAIYNPGVLADPRSGLQEALEVFEAALPKPNDRTPAQDNASQLVQLLRASPQLVLSEVIDDRTLLSIEQSTVASCVWIVMTDEWIEFEYPAAAVTFSKAVLDNLRRGVSYRYLVMHTAATRERAQEIIDLIRRDGFDDQLQIRFLSNRYRENLGASADGLVAYEADSTKLFFRFAAATPGGMRKWVRAPDAESEARLCDLHATWEMAEAAVEPASAPGSDPSRG